MTIVATKFGCIIPLSIVVSTWYFIIMPRLQSIPIEYYGTVNSPIDLGILMFITMIMVFIIVSVSRSNRIC